MPRLPTLDELDREIFRESFYDFVVAAWPQVYRRPMVETWHMRAMAKALQDTVDTPSSRTIFNLFPRSGKSSLISMLNPWKWLTDPAWSSLHILGSINLCSQFSRQTRELILSPWYQSLQPQFELSHDQNEKLNFANTAGGKKLSVPVGASVTGLDGDLLAIDDPNDAAAISDADLDDINERFDLSWSSRLVDPNNSSITVFQQRTHMKDLSGHLLEQAPDVWRHFVIRNEYEIDDPQKNPLDPRTVNGELAFPERIGPAYVRQQKAKGELFYEGQYQQRPVPRKGNLFDVDKIAIVDALPPTVTRDLIRCRAWDFAYTEDRGDYTASAMGVVDRNDPDFENMLYVIDVTEAQVKNPLSEYGKCLQLDPRDLHIRVPRDPGGGNRTADEAITMATGRCISDWRPTTKKESTWIPLANWVNAGRVRFVKGPWNQKLKDQMNVAPRGKHDDMIDACTELYSYLSQYGSQEMEISWL